MYSIGNVHVFIPNSTCFNYVFQNAIEVFKEVLKIKPDFLDASTSLGQAFKWENMKFMTINSSYQATIPYSNVRFSNSKKSGLSFQIWLLREIDSDILSTLTENLAISERPEQGLTILYPLKPTIYLPYRWEATCYTKQEKLKKLFQIFK